MTPNRVIEACPDCPHTPTDHGTYGCLHGWEWAHYSWGLNQGCRCKHRTPTQQIKDFR
jgi:hypothetical protein